MQVKPRIQAAYMVRLLNLNWAAKRCRDGVLIVEAEEKIDAKAAARNLGYRFKFRCGAQ